MKGKVPNDELTSDKRIYFFAKWYNEYIFKQL